MARPQVFTVGGRVFKALMALLLDFYFVSFAAFNIEEPKTYLFGSRCSSAD